MQRRPLEKIDRDEDEFQTPFERILNIFNMMSDTSSDIVSVQPLISSTSYIGLFQMIGFDACPLDSKKNKKLIYPLTAPEGQHPTGFLQFGAEIKRINHVVFEMGNMSNIIRFDFKEQWVAYQDDPIYQLDELQIWDGGIRYDIDCEDDFYRNYILRVMNVVSNVVRDMWDEQHEDAKASFDEIRSVICDLDDLSAQLTAQHNAKWLEFQSAERQNPTNTP